MSALRGCVEQFYWEVLPLEGIEDQLFGLSDGVYIGITCSPKRGLDETLDQVKAGTGEV